ncbi:MAG: ankyrin repeat domain-containing protein [Myxococcaceae bacterium]
MLKLLNKFLLISVSFSALALRDFVREYTPSRERILSACEKPKNVCNLKPLHEAVLRGDLEKIKLLVAEGADINAEARQKWTPAHFAVLYQGRSILELLFSLGANKEALDSNRATPEQIWNLTHLKDSLLINIWDEESQTVQQIDSKQFTALTGAKFVESVKMSPKTLANEWVKGFPISNSVQAILSTSKAHKPLKNQSDVYLRKMPGISGYSLYALRDFEPGEIVGEYQGEWTGKPNTQSTNEYATQAIDAAKLRGYVAFSPHGFPNTFLEPSEYLNGLRSNEVLLVSQPIKAHQPIMWNYRTHSVVWQYYQEQLPDVLDGYVSKNGLQYSQADVRGALSHFNIISYIYTTPSVFFRLVFEDKISNEDLTDIVRNKKLVQHASSKEHLASFETIQELLEDYLERIKRLDHKSRLNLKQFLASRAREGNIQVLIQMLANIEIVCENSNQDSWLSMLGLSSHKVCDESLIELHWYKLWIGLCKQELAPGFGNCKELEDLIPSFAEL